MSRTGIAPQEFSTLIKPEVADILGEVSGFLDRLGTKAYLVGGFVRDMLLGRETADIDIAVAGNALEIAAKVASFLGGKYVPLDEANRVARVILTTPAGDQWQFDFTSFGGDIEQDLAQRDFTIDAMAVDLKEFRAQILSAGLIDPFHGWDDLQRRLVRVVSEIAFAADAARLLRAVRLAAELDFTLDKATEDLVRRDSHLVTSVAGERTREELLRLLAVPRAELLAYLDELGLLTAIIPELSQAKGVTQPGEHFWDVFQHSLKVVAAVDFLLRLGTWDYGGPEVLAVVPWTAELSRHFDTEVNYGSNRRLLLKLAALLHDVAKPKTRTVEADGRLRFLGHPQEGAIVAGDILQRLRFSAKEIKLVTTMVEHHLRPVQMSQDGLPTRRAIYRYFRDTAEAGIDTLFLSLADHLATRGPHLEFSGWQEHARMVEYVLEQRFQQPPVVPPRLVSGHDLVNVFGMKPGPRLGEILEAVREAQAAGEVTTREDALAYIKRLLGKLS